MACFKTSLFHSNIITGFKVFTAMQSRIPVVWDVTSRYSASGSIRLQLEGKGPRRLPEGRRFVVYSLLLKMKIKATCFSETPGVA